MKSFNKLIIVPGTFPFYALKYTPLHLSIDFTFTKHIFQKLFKGVGLENRALYLYYLFFKMNLLKVKFDIRK